MRKTLIVILLLGILTTGCSKTTLSTNLIYDSSKIDVITFSTVNGEMTSGRNVEEKDKVRRIVKILQDIEVKELSLAEERKVFNKENWSERVQYLLTLVVTEEINSTDPIAQFKGLVTVLVDGRLMFSDPKTMGPFKDGKVERTVSYISIDKQVETIAEILRLADEK